MSVRGRRGHRQRDNLTRVRPPKKRRNKKTMSTMAAADESSGVDRKDVYFAKSSLRFVVQRRRESADVNR